MKSVSLPLAALLILHGFIASSLRAKPVDFSEFRGTFTGSAIANILTDTFTGTSQIQVSVPKSGSYALFRISASVTSNGTTIPLNNVVAFLSPKTVVTQNTLFEALLPLLQGSGTSGLFSGNARTLNFNAPFVIVVLGTPDPGTLSGTIRTQKIGRRQFLFVSMTARTTSNEAFSYDFSVSRRIQRK